MTFKSFRRPSASGKAWSGLARVLVDGRSLAFRVRQCCFLVPRRGNDCRLGGGVGFGLAGRVRSVARAVARCR